MFLQPVSLQVASAKLSEVAKHELHRSLSLTAANHGMVPPVSCTCMLSVDAVWVLLGLYDDTGGSASESNPVLHGISDAFLTTFFFFHIGCRQSATRPQPLFFTSDRGETGCQHTLPTGQKYQLHAAARAVLTSCLVTNMDSRTHGPTPFPFTC